MPPEAEGSRSVNGCWYVWRSIRACALYARYTSMFKMSPGDGIRECRHAAPSLLMRKRLQSAVLAAMPTPAYARVMSYMQKVQCRDKEE